MSELNDSVKNYVPTFTPHPLSSTIDGIKAAFAIMNTDEFKKLKGVRNRPIQPAWYKENPELSIIHNNEKYFNEFNELISKIKVINDMNDEYNDNIQYGGINENKTITLKGRLWNYTKKTFGYGTYGVLVASAWVIDRLLTRRMCIRYNKSYNTRNSPPKCKQYKIYDPNLTQKFIASDFSKKLKNL